MWLILTYFCLHAFVNLPYKKVGKATFQLLSIVISGAALFLWKTLGESVDTRITLLK